MTANLGELGAQAGLIIGNASYKLFGSMKGGRNILEVGEDRVAGTIGLYGGESVPEAITFVGESTDGYRTLEVHELGRSVCSPECAAWKITRGRVTEYSIAEVDLQTGKERWSPERRIGTDLQQIAPIMECVAFAGCNYDIVYLAGLIKSVNVGGMKASPGETSTSRLLHILQGGYQHDLAFGSTTGFLDQVRSLAGL